MEKEPEQIKKYLSNIEANNITFSLNNTDNNAKIDKLRKNESLVNLREPLNNEAQQFKKTEFSSERKIIIPEKKTKNNNNNLKNQYEKKIIFLDNNEDKPNLSPSKKEKEIIFDINVRSLMSNVGEEKLENETKNNSPFHKNLRIEPLSNFDEQLLKDFDPQELLSKGEQRGFSKWIDHDGETVWKECIILGYNQEKNKFIIRWINSDMKKEVNRLNLILPNENEEDFQKRTDMAMEKREKKLFLLQTLGFDSK